MLEQEYDAVLHHWCVAGGASNDDLIVLIGVITDDLKQRFADGRWMMTSMLVSPVDQIGEGTIVRTLNSRYLLGKPLDAGADRPRTRQ